LAREELEKFENVRFVQKDALRNKNQLENEILEWVQAELAVDSARRFKLAANLPFNVATPILSNLLASPVVPVSMTVTIQKELAERIAARPSTKHYSSLSVWIQSQCRVELVRVLPPSVFWPRPKVESAIVHIVPHTELRERISDVSFFHHFVRRLFLLRRKYLRGALFAALHQEMSKSEIDGMLQSLGFAPTVRAEELSVEEIIHLSDAVQALGQRGNIMRSDC
jgi:16S rRNA (adenine1518-N6/adenine1519-N6)-dimethyltransferase